MTIHVTVNRQAGETEEKNTTIEYAKHKNPKGVSWNVTLDSKLAAGDKVTVTQEYDGLISDGVVFKVQKGLNEQYKDDLKMPSDEIYIEQTVARLVNDEEQAEALRLVKAENPSFADDIASVELILHGDSDTKTATINVTYTDDTKSGEIDAPNLQIKQVNEISRGATISNITGYRQCD